MRFGGDEVRFHPGHRPTEASKPGENARRARDMDVALQTRSTRLKKRDERDELDIASPVLCDEENFTYLHLQKLRIRRGILAWFLRRVSQICQAYQHFVIGSGPLSDGLWTGVGHAQSSCTCYTIRAVCLTYFPLFYALLFLPPELFCSVPLRSVGASSRY
jgi:hypothetical protein